MREAAGICQDRLWEDGLTLRRGKAVQERRVRQERQAVSNEGIHIVLVGRIVVNVIIPKQGIGFSFLARMLRSKDTPEGCPQLMYQSVALSVLSCFTSEEEIMTNASVLFNLPILLDIITDADNPIYEENLVMVSDAYEILAAVVSYQKGESAS